MLGPRILPDSLRGVHLPSPVPTSWFGPRTPPPNGVSFLEVSNRLPFLSAGAKAFVCDQCGAQFSKEDALETHRQTHTGELTLLPLLQVPRRVTARGFAVSPRQHPFISDTHSFPGGAVSGAGRAGVTLPQKDSCPVRPRSVSNRPRRACLHRALQYSRGLRKSVTCPSTPSLRRARRACIPCD